MTSFRALAAAKVNLFLHVGPVKPNGRHDLDSLVVFSDQHLGDGLQAEPAEMLTLEVNGPFAAQAGALDDNLVLRSAKALQAASGTGRGARLKLTKRLPVAAGIGGGSSDAASALRLLTMLWEIDPVHAQALAPSLGGDVPVALGGVPALMRGEGEQVVAAHLPQAIPALLVNPLVACPTGPVFRAFDAAGGGADFALINPLPDFPDRGQLTDWLGGQRNDLEGPATVLVPQVGEVLAVLKELPGARLARMSGSGATCFALFDTISFAERASDLLKLRHPGWWSAPCCLGAAP